MNFMYSSLMKALIISILHLLYSSFFSIFLQFYVKCEGHVTVVQHNLPSSGIEVQRIVTPDGHKSPIRYQFAEVEQLKELIKVSRSCVQEVKFECRNARLTDNQGNLMSYWISRDGASMNYWGGAEGWKGCVCGMSGNCAGGPNAKCNCDKADNTLRSDSGPIFDKNHLPVTEIRIGGNSHRMRARFYLWPLRCSTYHYGILYEIYFVMLSLCSFL